MPSQVFKFNPNFLQILDSFLISRIARRVLAEQHIALSVDPVPGRVGVVTLTCSPDKVLRNVSQIVQDICERSFGIAPSFKITGDSNTTIPYLTHHLEFIALELLKNSSRATIEYWRDKCILFILSKKTYIIQLKQDFQIYQKLKY